LRKKQVSKAYPNMTDNEISQQIAGRLGVKIETTDSGPAESIRYPYIIQKSQYDVLFLMSRAHRIGYDLFVEEEGSNGRARPGKLTFQPSTSVSSTTFELEYGLTLIEFSPELNTADQVGKVTVKGWDALRKQPISASVTLKELKTKGVGKKGGEDKIKRSFEGREEVITDKPVNSYAEAKQLARETLQRIAKESEAPCITCYVLAASVTRHGDRAISTNTTRGDAGIQLAYAGGRTTRITNGSTVMEFVGFNRPRMAWACQGVQDQPATGADRHEQASARSSACG
jgi:phage protein D